MFTKTIIAATLASLAVAAPVEQRQTSNAFGMISTRSGSPEVHLRSVVANGQRFWIGKETATYCPTIENLDCATSTFPLSSPALTSITNNFKQLARKPLSSLRPIPNPL